MGHQAKQNHAGISLRHTTLIALIATAIMVGFGGCATGSGYYTQQNVGEIQTVYHGTVVAERVVEIRDEGTGTVLGALTGGILGNQVGKGSGKTAATIGGAVVGGALGHEVAKSTGQELTISLENGQMITTVMRLDKNNPFYFRKGDRVSVYMTSGRITQIRLIQK